MKSCRIGIIGAGRIGKLHAENIYYRLPAFTLAGITDPYIDVAWAESLHIPIVTKDADELIQDPNIDAIIIGSPSHLHVQQVIAASTANKAIFCEKPLGLTEAEIKTCLEVVEVNETLLQIGFNRRFDPNFVSIKQRAKSGAIGDLHLVRITSRDPLCPPTEYVKTSGGLFLDMAIHDFDMARFLMDSEVVEVYATGSILINPDIAKYHDVDTAIVQLRFANGALGVIDNSRQAVYGYDQRVELMGQQGTLLAKNLTQHAVVHMTRDDTRHSNPPYFFLDRYQAAYLAELNIFYDAWINAKPSPVTGHDGLQALKIAIAAKQSLQMNCPISIC